MVVIPLSYGSRFWLLSDFGEIKLERKLAPATKTIPANKKTIIASEPILLLLFIHFFKMQI
jgi:hypothetical protein